MFTHPQFGELRTVEISGEPWFVGKDVAEALGYSNTSKAIITHVADEDKIIKSVTEFPKWEDGRKNLYYQRIRSLLSDSQQQAFISKRVQALGYGRGVKDRGIKKERENFTLPEIPMII